MASVSRVVSPVASDLEPVPIKKIVLTGGPCGGKTSAMTVLQERFISFGWRVYCVPEAATIVLGGGVSFADISDEERYVVQVNIMRVMFQLEDSFYQIAKASGRKSLIICDRGAMDAAAYLKDAAFQQLLLNEGWDMVTLRDSRYDCVIHLQTAADGAAQFYTTHNNSARSETPEQACVLDRRVKECWLGHSYLYVVDNSTGFNQKISRVIEAVSKFLGISSVGIVKRKFLVSAAPAEWPCPIRISEVEHTYLLTSDHSEARVRKRGGYGEVFNYSLTFRYAAGVSSNTMQSKRNVSAREYSMLLSQQDFAYSVVCKHRVSFMYKNINFELDEFKQPHPGLLLLEAYLPGDVTVESALPPFLAIEREVTEDKSYSMRKLAHLEKPRLEDGPPPQAPEQE